MRFLIARIVVAAFLVGLSSSVLVGQATAASCGAGEFLVTGTFIDKTTGEPAGVVAEITFTSTSEGSRATSTTLPASTYQICLPAMGTHYWIELRADSYLPDQGGLGFDAEVNPVPAAGSQVNIDIAQPRRVDLFQSEMFFYRSDGLYRAYDPRLNGSIPGPLIAGGNWPMVGDWQFAYVPGVAFSESGSRFMLAYGPTGDLYLLEDPITYEASGFDEDERTLLENDPSWDTVTATRSSVLFYRAADGNYQWRRLVSQSGQPTLLDGPTQSDWTRGWTSIVPIDLDGDSSHELLFYRKTDGLYRYYSLKSDGSIGKPVLAGDDYTRGWDQITAVDLDGDGQDEIFFYREDGLFRYYDIRPDGTIPRPLTSGDEYTRSWDSITRFESCRVGSDWECPPR